MSSEGILYCRRTCVSHEMRPLRKSRHRREADNKLESRKARCEYEIRINVQWRNCLIPMKLCFRARSCSLQCQRLADLGASRTHVDFLVVQVASMYVTEVEFVEL